MRTTSPSSSTAASSATRERSTSADGERPAFISTSTPVPPATSVAEGSATRRSSRVVGWRTSNGPRKSGDGDPTPPIEPAAAEGPAVLLERVDRGPRVGVPAAPGGQTRAMPMANLLDHALRRLNALPDQEARMELLSCCGSRRWAARVSSGRPYADNAALLAEADAAWDAATEADVREAFAAHPRIGEAERGGAQERREQSASADANEATREALREGN